MYRAALGVYRAVQREFGAAGWDGNTVIAVGGGNNGGDGYALACILARAGCSCRIVKLSEKLTEDSGEAETAVRSDLTVSIGFVKQGLITEQAGLWMKRLVVADIGIVLARQEGRIIPAAEWEKSPKPGILPCPPWLEMMPIDVRNASQKIE